MLIKILAGLGVLSAVFMALVAVGIAVSERVISRREKDDLAYFNKQDSLKCCCPVERGEAWTCFESECPLHGATSVLPGYHDLGYDHRTGHHIDLGPL